jgi:predicted esterase
MSSARTRLTLVEFLFAALVLPASSGAVEIYDTFPAKIHPQERYVIYSHGLIVEGTDPKPVHPEYGIYDFPAIKQALFRDGGFNLIAEQRPKNTDIAAYTARLEGWVRELLKAGVPASRITLAGFSRGSHLAAYASARLRDTGIHTALMGSCVDGDVPGQDAPYVLGGDLLNIYETTDEVLSCAALAKRSKLVSFREIAITTGKKHGAFFQPRREWLAPLKQWIAETNR